MGNTHTTTMTETSTPLTHTSTGTSTGGGHTSTGTHTATHLGHTWTETGTATHDGHSHTQTATETSTPHTHTFTGTESSTLLNLATNQPQWQRVLSDEEAQCYWANYPGSVSANVHSGNALNTKTASFDWNFAARRGKDFRNVDCKQDGKYNKHLTDIEAQCYWNNNPSKAKSFKSNGHPLDVTTADYAWNFDANFNNHLGYLPCKFMLSTPVQLPPTPTPTPTSNTTDQSLSTAQVDAAVAALKKKLMASKTEPVVKPTPTVAPTTAQVAPTTTQAAPTTYSANAPTCPVAGENVTMPAGCKPLVILIL